MGTESGRFFQCVWMFPGWASHLAQQTLQLPLQVAVLALEHLVLGQGQLETGFQRKQVLLLLPARERRRLAVLDHALLPQRDL